MKKAIARTFGFLLPALAVVVVSHLIKQVLWAEVFDGMLASLVFSLLFAMGVWWGEKGLAISRERRPRQEVGIGLVAGAMMWTLLWIFWSVLPEIYQIHAAAWAFYCHLLVAFGTGWLSTQLRGGHSPIERAEQEMPSPSY